MRDRSRAPLRGRAIRRNRSFTSDVGPSSHQSELRRPARREWRPGISRRPAPFTRLTRLLTSESRRTTSAEPERAGFSSFSQPALVPAGSRYVALWIALSCVTAILVLAPGLPVAIYDPRLSVAAGSVIGAIGLALLQLGLLRFKVLHQRIDLYAGLGFGVLAFSNLFAAWAAPIIGSEFALERMTYFLLLARAMAAALFLRGLATSQPPERVTARISSGWLGPVCGVVLCTLAIGIVFSQDVALPTLLDVAARELLASHAPIVDLLPGQRPLLVVADALLALAFLVSALGYTSEGHRLRDPHIAALAVGLIFICFGQVHTVLFPLLPTEYLAIGDIFRLAAYALVLSNVMWRTAKDFAAVASQRERVRLSRELHDGLAQHLAILRLRLGRVAEDPTLLDHPSYDLQVALRVLENASIEARRAVATLRSEDVPWEEFEQALAALASEFSLTHDLDARVWTRSSDLHLDGQLQADVLGILQEAFSNASRHGEAKRIDAVVKSVGDDLLLTVRDRGRGFDPAHARRGVGLRSMVERVEQRNGTLIIDSAPGRGTRIRGWLPLRPPKQEPL